jgi:hypothetical protein
VNNLSRRLMDKLRNKIGKNLDEGQLRTLAGKVKREDLHDDEKLRHLIRLVAQAGGVSLTAEKEDRVLHMFRDQQVNWNDLQSVVKKLDD